MQGAVYRSHIMKQRANYIGLSVTPIKHITYMNTYLEKRQEVARAFGISFDPYPTAVSDLPNQHYLGKVFIIREGSVASINNVYLTNWTKFVVSGIPCMAGWNLNCAGQLLNLIFKWGIFPPTGRLLS